MSVMVLLNVVSVGYCGKKNAAENAQSIVDHIKSDEFKTSISENIEQIKKHIDHSKAGTDALKQKYNQKVAPIVKKSEQLLKQRLDSEVVEKKELLIFLSESMPDYEVWRFLNGGIKLYRFWNVRFVMRGMPQKGVTDKFAERKKKNIRLSVDPFLFDKHKISNVPVVILGNYQVNYPLNLSEVLELIGDQSGTDFSKMMYELQLP